MEKRKAFHFLDKVDQKIMQPFPRSVLNQKHLLMMLPLNHSLGFFSTANDALAEKEKQTESKIIRGAYGFYYRVLKMGIKKPII